MEKLNKTAHIFGHQLLDNGIKLIKLSFKLKPLVYDRSSILGFLNEELGIPNSTLSLSDQKYYTETWDKWEQIIENDLIDTQQYMHDYFDCDNYAFSYASRAGLIYGLNTCGVAFGGVYHPVSKELLGRHAFNLIVVHENRKLKLYLYEPMTDGFVAWQKGKDNILQVPTNWIYRPDWVLMY